MRMASKVLKCNECNIVIDEVLAFVQNKADIMNKDNLVQICNTAFSAEDITRAKTLLFESVPTATLKARRNVGKTVRDIEDILALIKGVDPELLPIFVAKDLNKLPPVCFDHVDPTRLLKDILLLQNEIREFKTECVTKEELRVIQNELDDMKRETFVNNIDYVTKKRGTHIMNSFMYNSGPMGLNHVSLESSNQHCTQIESLAPASPVKRMCEMSNKDRDCSSDAYHDARNLEKSPLNTKAVSNINKQSILISEGRPVADYASQGTSPTASAQVTELESSESNSQQLYSQALGRESNKLTKNEQVVRENEWQTVTTKKRKRDVNHFVGKLGKGKSDPDCKFKSVEVKIPLYISHVCKDTREEDIIEYIREKTGEVVILYKINMHTLRKYDSYKLYVSKNKMEILLDSSFWPNGIRYRRFSKRINKDKESGSVDCLNSEIKKPING